VLPDLGTFYSLASFIVFLTTSLILKGTHTKFSQFGITFDYVWGKLEFETTLSICEPLWAFFEVHLADFLNP